MTSFWIPFSAGLIACLITTIGIYVINHFAAWGKRNVVYFMSFAAGVLISVSLMHIVPEAIEMSEFAPVGIFAGYIALYLFDRFWHGFVCSDRCKHGLCRDKNCKDITLGVIPAIGIAMHSFIDGIIYSVTFSVSVFTGVLSVIGMILHEFPEGIVTFLFLAKSGVKKAAFYAFLAAALTTPLGVLVSWPFINGLSENLLGVLLSLSGGALIYVGATHLLPKVQEEPRKYTFLAMAAGIAVAVVIIMSHGHMH